MIKKSTKSEPAGLGSKLGTFTYYCVTWAGTVSSSIKEDKNSATS